MCVLVAMGVIWAEASVYRAIRQQAATDEIHPADAIVVFGAAQYNGAPSPVFKARLDHALELEERGLAPIIITTGGSGGDALYTEGGVARDYLIQQGVAAERILAETESQTTYENVLAASRLLRKRGARSCIAVSDGFHLYRIKLMFASQGMVAYASPAPASPIENDPVKRTVHSLRETFVSTLWHLGFRG